MKKTIGALLILLVGIDYIAIRSGYGELAGVVISLAVILICGISVITYFTSGMTHVQTEDDS